MQLLNSLPHFDNGPGLKCLDGVRVLDFTTSVAGPYGTLLLADMGAEVIKVEKRLGGDDARSWGPPFLDGESLWFLSMNRNKQSLSLDLMHPGSSELIEQLVRIADVVVLNSTHRIQTKLGLNYEKLQKINPKLIHVSVTGFGLTGPRAELPCYDLIAEGYSGVMHLTGESGRPPQKVGTPAADLLAGQDIAMATLAALFERSKTGLGKQIDVSMVATMARFMSPRIVPYLGSSEAPIRSGGTDSVIAIYQVFDTQDFPITLGLGNDAIWKRFWSAVDMPEYADRTEFETNARRRQERVGIVEDIAAVLIKQPRSHWLQLFEHHRIPAGPINSIEQLVKDQPLRESGLFFNATGVHGAIPQVGLGIRFNGSSSVLRSAPPLLGEHNHHILKETLSMSEEAIAGLVDSSII